MAERPFTVANFPVSSRSFAIHIWLATILVLLGSFWQQVGAPTHSCFYRWNSRQPDSGSSAGQGRCSIARRHRGVTASIAIAVLFSQDLEKGNAFAKSALRTRNELLDQQVELRRGATRIP